MSYLATLFAILSEKYFRNLDTLRYNCKCTSVLEENKRLPFQLIVEGNKMAEALAIIGIIACVAAIVLFVMALIKRSGWGVVRSGAIFMVGLILFIVGVITSSPRETVSPVEVPTPTREAELGKSRDNPVPFGMSLTYGDQQLTILGSERLNKIGWSTPDEGNIYLAVKLRVNFVSERTEKRNYLSASDFRVVGTTGYVYDHE